MIHKDTKIDLFPITVLVGPNSGGKSALFDAILNFSMVSRGRLSQAFGPGPFSFGARKYHGAGRTARVSFEVCLSERVDSSQELAYHLSYSQIGGEEGSYIIHDEKLEDKTTGELLFDRSDPESYRMGKTSGHLTDDRSIFAAIRVAQLAGEYEESSPLVTVVAREISRVSKLRLDPTNLARPSKIPEIAPDRLSESPPPRLDYRGEDLPAVLYYLSETESPALERITGRLNEVLTGFEGFEFNAVQTDRIGFAVRFSDVRGTVPAANLSDGTLTLIGLITLLMNPDPPSVVCLEEPENGLTPRTTRAVYEAIRELALEADSRSQILLSSHSPFVICAAWNGEDREFIYHLKSDEGTAEIRKFSEIIEEHEIQLRKEKGGERGLLGLETANQIMEGYYT